MTGSGKDGNMTVGDIRRLFDAIESEQGVQLNDADVFCLVDSDAAVFGTLHGEHDQPFPIRKLSLRLWQKVKDA